MTCPNCGTVVVSLQSDRCSACGRTLPSRRQVAAGLLTPVPIPPAVSDTDDVTVFGAHVTMMGDEERTTFVPPPGDSRATSLDDATRFVAPARAADETALDEDGTRFLAPSADASATSIDAADTSATSFEEKEESTQLNAPSGEDDAATSLEEPTQLPLGHADAPTSGVPALDDAPTLKGPATASTRRQATRASAKSTSGPLAVGQAFSSRYHIIKVLGIGGMGAVYQAWDAELGMAVALKVIRPEATSDPAAAREMERRFKQELVLARQVTHKNVVRIHDLGEIDGIKYITMPYLDGSDLATIMKKDGKMPVPAALRIMRDVAAGLVAAHEAGIVHRDLKPANIMVLSDHAVIMDFGIARSSTAVAAEPKGPTGLPSGITSKHVAAAATVVGTIMGTVQYMAPEQARGEAVDQRADVYALGLIFSDMLLGKRQAKADENAFDELKRRLKEAPPKVRTIDPTIPEALEEVIARSVEPDASKRPQTSKELVAELDRLDENGVPIPVKRMIGLPLMAGVIVSLLALSASVWWYQRQFIPAAEHAPVSVLIADFQNGTNDPSFDRTLEPVLKLAMEGASFISAYDRTQMRNLGLPAVSGELDEPSARKIALSQGLGVVVAGTVGRRGNGYELSLKAMEAVTGNVIASAQDSVSSKDGVVPGVTRLASAVRTALGDEMSESAQMFAMETLTAQSLDVIQQYAAAMEALNNGKYEEARSRAAKAAELDPNFGSAYGVMAAASRSLGQRQEAETYIKEAVAHLDRVTERERYRIRGLSFLLSGDQQKCVEEYGALISRYAADATAHNNLALCATQLRDMPKAIEEMKLALAVLPKSVRQRSNLAVYASYGGDFATGELEALEVQKLDPAFPKGFIAQAFAQLGQDRLTEAADTYRMLQPISASDAASGLADVAVYEGRFSEAVRILEAGAAADVAAKNADRAADKFAALAYARLSRGQRGPALQAAERALANSKGVKTRFMVGRIFALAGEAQKARGLAATLASELYAEPQAYGKIIEGDVFLQAGDARQAIKSLSEANALLDTWLGRFDLGRAYLAAEAYLDADAEFDRCLKRRGEAMALFLDEVPTYGYFPPVYYYLGRVREGLKTASFADFYRTYLNVRGAAGEDPLLADAKKRAGK